ncbi:MULTISPECIES: hypothetical protein [unclassified Modestobacter]|uniref:hypothetical protein n=1 Tax=unclassified Modestobacter TaxID=2643866 RepID=UPI0022A9FC7D|nr:MULTISPECIES: hypothetical protein [unclassified Modestobacter]MCZ2811051.1 hypothetical protein [Modestobacter sp. VKM Ac-2979]MCZ2840564.1 hypothetical protein [Modestobacter sp. VKM Ac-2980]MCZ2847851.1 hypothetical protein [Modestobacter sp. VKM Ac-2978]
MTSPEPRANRQRLIGLFLLGVALVLLVSSVTWFGSDRGGIGIAQVAVALVAAVVGAVVVRRAPPR